MESIDAFCSVPFVFFLHFSVYEVYTQCELVSFAMKTPGTQPYTERESISANPNNLFQFKLKNPF